MKKTIKKTTKQKERIPYGITYSDHSDKAIINTGKKIKIVDTNDCISAFLENL